MILIFMGTRTKHPPKNLSNCRQCYNDMVVQNILNRKQIGHTITIRDGYYCLYSVVCKLIAPMSELCSTSKTNPKKNRQKNN